MLTVKCPTCKRSVDWNETSTYRPFCSNRCRLIDLGEWFSEGHAIPGDPVIDGDEPQPAPESQDR
jgi:endogenous inhibitor of DNA gyrase (YacG/DUF329 family)